MKYEEFKKEFQNRILSYLPVTYQDWKVSVHEVYKVNRKLDGFSLLPPKGAAEGTKACPVFYLQDLYEMYEAGISMGKIFRQVAGFIETPPEPQELNDVKSRMEKLKSCLVLQLINRERNQELLKTLPHRNFLDLAAVCRVMVPDGEGAWSGMLVTKDLMKEWNLNEKELYQLAWEHTREVLPFLLKNTGRMFQSGIILEENPNRMYILTNEALQFGASAMLYPDVLELAAEQFGSGFAILPGSIHELYLLKESPETALEWEEVLYMANRELVAEADYLSDHIYYYDAEKKTVTILRSTERAG